MERRPEHNEISGIGKALKRLTEAETALGLAGVALGLGFPALAIASQGAFQRGLIWLVEKGYLGQADKSKGR